MRRATITTTIEPSILNATEADAKITAEVDGVEVYSGRTYGWGSVKVKQKDALKVLRAYVAGGAVERSKTVQEFYVDGTELVAADKVRV